MNEEFIKQAFSIVERVANDSRTELKIRLDAQVLLKKMNKEKEITQNNETIA